MVVDKPRTHHDDAGNRPRNDAPAEFDKTIASTSNMVSGRAGFAFKVGWDGRFRKYGVGILNAIQDVYLDDHITVA